MFFDSEAYAGPTGGWTIGVLRRDADACPTRDRTRVRPIIGCKSPTSFLSSVPHIPCLQPSRDMAAEIAQYLAATLSPDTNTRIAAELKLSELSTLPGPFGHRHSISATHSHWHISRVLVYRSGHCAIADRVIARF